MAGVVAKRGVTFAPVYAFAFALTRVCCRGAGVSQLPAGACSVHGSLRRALRTADQAGPDKPGAQIFSARPARPKTKKWCGTRSVASVKPSGLQPQGYTGAMEHRDRR